jgi:hypothetical protein
MSVLRPDLMMRCVVPVIMAGIIAVSVCILRQIMLDWRICLLDLWSCRLGLDLWKPYVLHQYILGFC